MQRFIKQVLRWLIIEFAAAWILVILTFIAGELNLIPNGAFHAVGGSQTEYYLNLISVVLVIVCIYLAMQLFSLNTRRSLKRMNHDEALRTYHVWSIVRLALLLVAAIYGITIYFLLMESTGILCACMAMVATLACVPSEDKLNKYIEALDNKTDVEIETEDK